MIRPLTGVDAPGFSARHAIKALSVPIARAAENCAEHWQYLLSNQATLVHLQCPNCGTLWSTDTRERTIRRYKAA